MNCETKISKGFQTVVPAEIRNKFNIGPGDILEWISSGNKIEVRCRRRVTVEDVFGVFDGPEDNAVEAKKRIARGGKL